MAFITPAIETSRTRMSNFVIKLAVFRFFLHDMCRNMLEIIARLPIKMISIMTTVQMRAPVKPS